MPLPAGFTIPGPNGGMTTTHPAETMSVPLNFPEHPGAAAQFVFPVPTNIEQQQMDTQNKLLAFILQELVQARVDRRAAAAAAPGPNRAERRAAAAKPVR